MSLFLWCFFSILSFGYLGPTVASASEPSTTDATLNQSSKGAKSSIFDPVEDLSSQFERRLAMYNILEDANKTTLDDYFDQIQRLNSDSLRFEVERSIVEKWAMIDPPAALAKVDGLPEHRFRELVKVVFDEWFYSDSAAAMDYASELSQYKKRIVFEGSLLSREDLGVEEKLELARQLDIEFIANSLIEEKMQLEPLVDAEKYWASFSAAKRNRFISVDRDHLFAIADSLVAQLGKDAFLLVDESTPNIDDKNRILPKIATLIARADPRAAFELLRDRKRRLDEVSMLWGVVSTWATVAPEEAFEAVSKFERRSKRTSLQEAVLNVWAANANPRELLDFAGKLPKESRSMVQESALTALAGTAPEEALELTREMQDATVRDRLENSIATSWAQSDPESAIAWTRSEPTVQHKRFQLMSEILSGMARTDFNLAFETALAEPANESGVGLEASVVRGSVPMSEEIVPKVLERMRNEQTKLLGMLSIGAGFVQWGTTESIDSAFSMSSLLKSEEHRHRYLGSLVLAWVAYGQEQDLYNRLDQFPTAELKRQAAYMLKINESENFTERQLQRIESYLENDSSQSSNE